MASFCKIELIGYVGTDPDVRIAGNGSISAGAARGSKVASFRLSTMDGQKTMWHNIVCWERLADLSEKTIRKGFLLFVAGRLRQKEWMDNTGKIISRLEVAADNIQILAAPMKEVASREPATKGLPSMDPQPDDLPF